MTDAEINDLSDMELGRKVAEAMGWTYAGFCRQGPVYEKPISGNTSANVEIGIDFCPVTDWNHTLAAVCQICKASARHPDGMMLYLTIIPHESYFGFQIMDGAGEFSIDHTPASFAALPRAVCVALIQSTGYEGR